MIRNLKALGLAVMAILALGAVAASGAQAELSKFTATEGGYPILLKGEQLGANTWSVGGGVRTASCAEAKLEKSVVAETSSVAGVEAEYSSCTGNGETTGTIKTNGCTYTLTSTTTRPTADTGKGKTALVCSGGGIGLDIRIWSKGVSHANFELCTYLIPAQTFTGEYEWHIRNTGTATEDLELTLTGLGIPTVEVEKGTVIACGKNAPPTATTTGTYVGNTTITASISNVHKKIMIG